MPKHGNAGNTNAKKEHPLPATITFRCTSELALKLSEHDNPNLVARTVLENHYGLNKSFAQLD